MTALRADRRDSVVVAQRTAERVGENVFKRIHKTSKTSENERWVKRSDEYVVEPVHGIYKGLQPGDMVMSVVLATELAGELGRLPKADRKKVDVDSEEFQRLLVGVMLRQFAKSESEKWVIAYDPRSHDTAGKGLGQIVSIEEGRKRLAPLIETLTLEEWAGQVAGGTEIAKKLGIPRSTLDSWRKSDKVIGLLSGLRKHAYPVEQFIDGRPTPNLDKVVEIVGDSRTAWLWLREPNPTLHGKRPIDLLKSGRSARVLRAAYDYFAAL